MILAVIPISIELMLPSDIPAAERIDRLCFAAPWAPGAFTTELSNRSAYYLVAREGKTIVGYAGQWVIMGEAHITTLAVHPEYQGRRIGQRLLLALLKEAVALKASHASLEVRAGNKSAQHIYCKFGFEQTSIRRNYYTDNGESAIVMWANAIAAPEYSERLQQLRRSLYEERPAR